MARTFAAGVEDDHDSMSDAQTELGNKLAALAGEGCVVLSDELTDQQVENALVTLAELADAFLLDDDALNGDEIAVVERVCELYAVAYQD